MVKKINGQRRSCGHQSLSTMYVATTRFGYRDKNQCLDPEQSEGLGLAVGGACLLLLLLGSSFHVHVCHFRGALHVHWVCRVVSGPWN